VQRQDSNVSGVTAGRVVQQSDFKHVVNTRQDLRQIERLAEEILRAAL
jgi:hypothetical protein